MFIFFSEKILKYIKIKGSQFMNIKMILAIEVLVFGFICLLGFWVNLSLMNDMELIGTFAVLLIFGYGIYVIVRVVRLIIRYRLKVIAVLKIMFSKEVLVRVILVLLIIWLSISILKSCKYNTGSSSSRSIRHSRNPR